ncbi:hypothetical protein [Cohnella phaseoli]|uniref:hypothetical protein n=1 Tax=Cohnella phaseoli TaxID=456490 RepID=UPI001C6E0672|nr:hypothetical protein [Cohnella phaseoli]
MPGFVCKPPDELQLLVLADACAARSRCSASSENPDELQLLDLADAFAARIPMPARFRFADKATFIQKCNKSSLHLQFP